jgi:hypothetical protein
MNKVALIIIYNHQYNKNIAILEQIYKDRFSNIYHLVPFYNGEKQNVIPVYESSHYFQGYVAQGFKVFFNANYEHYFFVADDLILNPLINENNYKEHLKLKRNSCFIPAFITLHDKKCLWGRIGDAFRYNINVPGIEAKVQLPEYDIALQKFKKFGLEIEPIIFSQIWKTPSSLKDWLKKFVRDRSYFIRFIKSKFSNKGYKLSYPLVGSYSDIFVVSSDAIKQFSHYCGVFASTNLFVEIGLPTSMVLSAQDIVTENILELQGKALWPDGWARMNGDLNLAQGDHKIMDNYNYNLKQLMNNFQKGNLYLHPIKLSKWDTEF